MIHIELHHDAPERVSRTIPAHEWPDVHCTRSDDVVRGWLVRTGQVEKVLNLSRLFRMGDLVSQTYMIVV